MPLEPTYYLLNPLREIIGIGGQWDAFALENNGENLHGETILGRSIWDFIQGDTTRMWLDSLLQLAELRNVAIERPYRCDSPDLRRYMLMRLVPQAEGNLRIEHQTLQVESQPEPVYIFHASVKIARILRARCSVCGRLELESGNWIEPKNEPENLIKEISVYYKVCGDCANPFVNSPAASLHH